MGRGETVPEQAAIMYVQFRAAEQGWGKKIEETVRSLPKLVETNDPVTGQGRIEARSVGVATIPFVHGMDVGHFLITVHVFLSRHPERDGKEEEMAKGIGAGLSKIWPGGNIQVAISSGMVALAIRKSR